MIVGEGLEEGGRPVVDAHDLPASLSDWDRTVKRWSQWMCSTSRSARSEHRGMFKHAPSHPPVIGKTSDRPSGLQLIRMHQGSILWASLEARSSVGLHRAELRAAQGGLVVS